MTLRLPAAISLLALPALLTACQTAPAPAATAAAGPQAYAGIGAEEQLRFAGTEPFWGGEVRAGKLVFTSPDNATGETAQVTRAAGGGGVVFSGRLAAGPFTLTARIAACSDGMSGRTYPFAVAIEFPGQTLQGCGWTARQPFTGDAG